MRIDERLFGRIQRNLIIGVCAILLFVVITSILSKGTLSAGERDVFLDNSYKDQNATYNLIANNAENTQTSSEASEPIVFSHDLLPAIPQQISRFLVTAAIRNTTPPTTTAITATVTPTSTEINNSYTTKPTVVPQVQTQPITAAPPITTPHTTAPGWDIIPTSTGTFTTIEPCEPTQTTSAHTEPSSSVEPSASTYPSSAVKPTETVQPSSSVTPPVTESSTSFIPSTTVMPPTSVEPSSEETSTVSDTTDASETTEETTDSTEESTQDTSDTDPSSQPPITVGDGTIGYKGNATTQIQGIKAASDTAVQTSNASLTIVVLIILLSLAISLFFIHKKKRDS